MRLYLLMPTARILAAKRHATAPIAVATVVAVVVATALSSWLSSTISRPVRELAGHMEMLAQESVGTTALGPAGMPPELRGALGQGPAEIAQLVEAFDRLLGHLHGVRAQLVQSERLTALGELATSIAHECRNPLSGIKMNVRVLADELARAGIKDDPSVELIVREIDRLDLYFAELLQFAAGGTRPAGTGAESASARGADVAEAASAVLRLLEGRCRHAQVQVSREFEPPGGTVVADPGEVRQVLLNLCLNALDAMPDGGCLTVGARRAGASTLRVFVLDTGTGIKALPGQDIFSPFVSTKPHGAGLGLHICRKIVERGGGRIGYDVLDRGTRFWFDLPVAP
jgi:signal transduction histidine kinase